MATKRDLKAVEQKLLAHRQELAQQMSELERQSLGLPQSEASGETAFDDEYADSGTATFERERDFSLQENLRDLIEQVDHALERVRDGSYGTCESCKKTIEAARLKALPYASLCIDCKKREEARR